MPEELKGEAIELLKKILLVLQGLFIENREQRHAHRRSMDAATFNKHELRALTREIRGFVKRIEEKK